MWWKWLGKQRKTENKLENVFKDMTNDLVCVVQYFVAIKLLFFDYYTTGCRPSFVAERAVRRTGRKTDTSGTERRFRQPDEEGSDLAVVEEEVVASEVDMEEEEEEGVEEVAGLRLIGLMGLWRVRRWYRF